MIKVSVMYPMQPGAKFDMAYYVNRHMPLVQKLVGPSLKRVAVDQGISGVEPGSTAPYVAIGHALFETIADFQNSFGPHAQTIMADIPNYSNVPPVIQISEVKL